MVEKCENLTFFSAVIVEAQKRQAYNLIIVKVYDVKRGIAEKFSALIFHFFLILFLGECLSFLTSANFCRVHDTFLFILAENHRALI